MKRDMDLIRQMLLACEASPTGYMPENPTIAGHSAEEVGYHAHLLIQAGLATGPITTHSTSAGPEARVRSITWAGHEFLDAARDDGTWEKAKAAVHRSGGLSFEVLKAVLVKYGAELAGRLLS